jgi:hypothetical protein
MIPKAKAALIGPMRKAPLISLAEAPIIPERQPIEIATAHSPAPADIDRRAGGAPLPATTYVGRVG